MKIQVHFDTNNALEVRQLQKMLEGFELGSTHGSQVPPVQLSLFDGPFDPDQANDIARLWRENGYRLNVNLNRGRWTNSDGTVVIEGIGGGSLGPDRIIEAEFSMSVYFGQDPSNSAQVEVVCTYDRAVPGNQNRLEPIRLTPYGDR